jgi:hypothetical protein
VLSPHAGVEIIVKSTVHLVHASVAGTPLVGVIPVVVSPDVRGSFGLGSTQSELRGRLHSVDVGSVCACMQGLMSLLNAFSGAIFLTVGIVHLLPHVLEYQELAYPSMRYPLGLVSIVLGFLLILFVEQVVFDVHGIKYEEDIRSDSRTTAKEQYALIGNTLSIGRKYRDPLLTELALNIHATLESIVLGLAVRSHTLHTLLSSGGQENPRDKQQWKAGKPSHNNPHIYTRAEPAAFIFVCKPQRSRDTRETHPHTARHVNQMPCSNRFLQGTPQYEQRACVTVQLRLRRTLRHTEFCYSEEHFAIQIMYHNIRQEILLNKLNALFMLYIYIMDCTVLQFPNKMALRILLFYWYNSSVCTSWGPYRPQREGLPVSM